jgi:hypothetical protein
MATLDSLRPQLRRDLRDEDAANYRWPDTALNRHIERAGRELSLVLPRERKSTFQTSAGSREISIASLADLVRVFAVEWPAGQYPAAFVRFSVWETALTLLVDAAPAGLEDVAVYWGSVHEIDGAGCTAPAYTEEALVLGAAGYAALEWASFATNRINAAGAGAVADYSAWGTERLRQFRAALRTFGRNGRVRPSRLYVPGGEPASQDVVQWEAG